jgi:hypothetical protein
MKILHLTTSNEGGAGIFAADFKRYFDDSGHENEIFTFNDFLKKRFIKRRFSVLIYLFKSFLILKFWGGINTKTISPLFSLWSPSKIKDLVSDYDLVVIQRFSNFLSFQEIIRIIESSKKVIIIGIDEGLFTPYCTFTFDCDKYIEACEKCPVAPKSKFQLITSNYLKIENILKVADFSNTEIVVASDFERIKLQNSFWRKAKIKVSSKIFPYHKVMSNEYLNTLFTKKINLFDHKLIITISALYPTKRKGFDLVVVYLENLNNLLSDKNSKKIEINIITGKSSVNFDKFSNKNLEIKCYNILNKKAFEIMLAKSHLFLSFSRADSGPFTLNMCYYLKTMIFSFRVGVATEIEKKTKSIRIIDNFLADNMAKETIKLMNESNQKVKNLLSYNIETTWN